MTQRLKRWTSEDPSYRRTIINELFAERRATAEIANRMDLMRENHREGAETQCMTLVGPPGVGKSSFLRMYEQGNPIIETRDENGIRRQRPVVYAELLPDTTVIAAAETVMKALMGDRAPTGSKVRDHLMEQQLRIQRVELLILDEFQHVAERGADITRARTADWVKAITKRTRVPVVMAGMSTIDTLVDANPQLYSITPYRFAIPIYDYTSKGAKRGFRAFLKDCDERLPFDQLSLLNDPARANALHLASGGNLRALMRLMLEAGRTAIADKAVCIRDSDFQAACLQVGWDKHCPSNPFDALLDEDAA